MEQSLSQIMDELPVDFIEKVKTTDNVPALLQMKWETTCPNKLAVIDARIQRINHLVL